MKMKYDIMHDIMVTHNDEVLPHVGVGGVDDVVWSDCCRLLLGCWRESEAVHPIFHSLSGTMTV